MMERAWRTGTLSKVFVEGKLLRASTEKVRSSLRKESYSSAHLAKHSYFRCSKRRSTVRTTHSLPGPFSHLPTTKTAYL